MFLVTKEKYRSELQCQKIMWLKEHRPELTVKQEDYLEEVRKRGYEKLREAAKLYFPSCAEVFLEQNKKRMIQNTKKYLLAGETHIMNASFSYGEMFCSVDMIERKEGKIHLYKISNSTRTRIGYYDDMAYEYYVLSHCFKQQELGSMYHMHLNSKYIRKDRLEIKKLFVLENCTEEVRKRKTQVKMVIDSLLHREEEEKEPDILVGEQCCVPKHCEYKEYCHKKRIDPSVFSLHSLQVRLKYDFYRRGIISFMDLLRERGKIDSNEIGEKQWLQIETEVYQREPIIKKEEIKRFLETLKNPMYFLDFETFQQAIPLYPGVRPYMPIPFQYSLHVVRREKEAPEHFEFLAQEGSDPRRAFAKRLCEDIPRNVCVVAYGMEFEKRVLRNLAGLYEDLSEHLMDIHDNMRDLMVPFREKSYYCREMKGSYSLKAVLPALYPGEEQYDYHALRGIHNGEEAMNSFAGLEEKSLSEKKRIREELLAYCCLDTLGLVKILEKLREAVRE